MEPNDLENEVNEIDDFGIVEDEDVENKEPEKEEAVEEPVKDLETEEAVKEESSEVVKSESESEPEVKVEAQESDIIALMRKQIEELNGQILSLKSNKPVEQKKEETLKTEDKEPVKDVSKMEEKTSYEPIDFIGSLDMDDVAADKSVLNNLFNAVVQKAVEYVNTNTRPSIAQEVLLSIPNVIAHQVREHSYLSETVNKFYEENSDLAEFKNVVSNVAQAIAAEHPEYQPMKLFSETAVKARQVIGLPASPIKKEAETEEFNKPAFAATTSKRQQTEKISALQKELDEL